MIIDWKSAEAEIIFRGETSKKLPSDIQNAVRRKLFILNNALTKEDLNSPPGNQLEALKGDRAGQQSIRVNDQWRVCFVWDGHNASEVEVVDYH